MARCEKIKLHGRDYLLFNDKLIATEEQIANLSGSYATISESGGVYRLGELVAIRSEIEFMGEFVDVSTGMRRKGGVQSCLESFLSGLKDTSETSDSYHSFLSLVESMAETSKRSRKA